MGDENPIRTLGDYSKLSYEGYRNTIELPVGNNVVPFRSDTIRLMQNGCSFHGLRSEDLNQHLKDFLKLLAIGLNVFQQDPSPQVRILLPDSLLNSFHREGSQNSAMISWCSNNIMENLYPKHGLCKIDRATAGKLRNKNADESWEIIENLTLYDHEGWNDTKEFVKPVKAISTPQGFSKTPDQIKFLLMGSQPTPRSSTHIPHDYANAVHSNLCTQSHNAPSKLNPFSFRERTVLSPQPQALGTTFEARVRDYMAAHSERMERFENAISKQREEINDRITEMFELLKEPMTSRAPEKVLIKDESKFLVAKKVNSIFLAKGEEERSDKTDETLDNTVNLP
ncbi:hypothetical protein Tco_0791279 [Tanacetum coccineum]